ncbi:cytochrome c heme lyase, putative [Plasmodium sp. gorilla clade G1]|nr:cytochrome c heme lyase, putative [Plasmodium sp. gorilla clade G1]
MQNLSPTCTFNKNEEKIKCPSSTKLGCSDGTKIIQHEINERNMMPEIPNVSLTDENDFTFNKKRHVSSIPKNNNEYWVYPSSQQFYNSLIRKNKDIDKNYIDAVVSVHNEVNEESWKQILKYEHMHKRSCTDVTLHRFLGKFDDLSIKARFRSIFSSMGRPFDRHDWYVNRCGTQVKYILDYYNDESINDDKNIYIDVRPAMNSFSNVWDRLRYPFYEFYFKYVKKDELFK